ncbi:unnamed protein product [Protopolystoma xenopodis]|uniref:Uncharacterized protein n=1 Tax=Protopolystoma xenopodis TaxID=117903 RepID=A0A3S5CGS9_9PLAT|nr:unnamed protein product [Protopolystoma xenopodis]
MSVLGEHKEMASPFAASPDAGRPSPQSNSLNIHPDDRLTDAACLPASPHVELEHNLDSADHETRSESHLTVFSARQHSLSRNDETTSIDSISAVSLPGLSMAAGRVRSSSCTEDKPTSEDESKRSGSCSTRDDPPTILTMLADVNLESHGPLPMPSLNLLEVNNLPSRKMSISSQESGIIAIELDLGLSDADRDQFDDLQTINMTKRRPQIGSDGTRQLEKVSY